MRWALLGAAIVIGVVAFLSVPGGSGENPSSAPRPQSQSIDFIRSVEVIEVDEGVVYRVRPTRAGRLAGSDDLDQAWRQAVREGVPDRASLAAQFRCHPDSVVARAKPTWDLESWRPAVGRLRTMLAGCNP